MSVDVFMSVGRTATMEQEQFVREFERVLGMEGLRPRTLGRAEYSAIQPLKAVQEIMDECSGTVIIAFERTFSTNAVQRRGTPEEVVIDNLMLPTVWNQIEAAMAYVKRHPLLVVVESGLMREGLLEPGYDWYVQVVPIDTASVGQPETLGRLRDWKKRVEARARDDSPATAQKSTPSARAGEMPIAELLGSLRPAELWAVILGIGSLVAGAFAIGTRF